MTKLMLHRVRMIFIMVIAIFILLSGRLAYLQILRHDYYWNRSEKNRYARVTLSAPRGEIFDREGRLLFKQVDDEIAGYRVAAIEPGRVELIRGTSTLWIEVPKPSR